MEGQSLKCLRLYVAELIVNVMPLLIYVMVFIVIKQKNIGAIWLLNV